MGAGKSTVGRLLAPMLGWQFQDADTLIVNHAGLSIAEIFSIHGEPYFRQLEATLVQETLAHPASVLALGGGALEHEETRRALMESPDTLVVYLAAPLSVLLARCQTEIDAAVRPVLGDDALGARFARRIEWYEECAGMTLPTEGRSPAELAETIAGRLQSSHISK